MPVFVVSSQSAPSLLVTDWLLEFSIDWQNFRYLKRSSPSDTVHEVTAESVVNSFADLFTEELGLIKGVHANVQLRPDATPKFYKPRPVPFADKEKIEADLEHLTKMGVIEPMLRSDWAAPIVPVMKVDGKKLCVHVEISALL